MIGRDATATTMTCFILVVILLPLILGAAQRFMVLTPVLVGLTLRTIIGVGSHLLFGLSSDARGYDELAVDLVRASAGEMGAVWIPEGKDGWPRFLAAIYSFIGHAPEVGITVNVLAGTATILLVAMAPRYLGWQGAVQPAAWIMALWPVAFFWGPLLLREATITFLVALAMLSSVIIRTRSIPVGVALLMLSGFVMLFMRGGLAIMILAVMPATIALTQLFSAGGANRMKVFIPAVLATVVAMPLLISRFAGSQYFDSEAQQQKATALDGGTTGFTSAGAGGGLVTGTLNIAAGPFPWMWRNFGLLMAGADAMLWISLYVLAYTGARHNRVNRWAYILLLVPPLALIIYMSNSATNFGLVMRMRTMNVPFLAPLAGLGAYYLISQWRERRDRRIPLPISVAPPQGPSTALRKTYTPPLPPDPGLDPASLGRPLTGLPPPGQRPTGHTPVH